MAAIDPEFERHRRMWLGFGRFLRWGIGIVIVILILMAIFLV